MPGHQWQIGQGVAPDCELTKDAVASQKAISMFGKPVCLVHLTLSGCPMSCRLAVVNRWEEAALTEEVGTMPTSPSVSVSANVANANPAKADCIPR